MQNTGADAPQTPKKTGKILLMIAGVVLVSGTIIGILVYGPTGEFFKGSTIPSDHTFIDCDASKGLTEKLPEGWWGIEDESCTCDTSKNWVQGPDIPNQFCGENISCLRLEEYETPCVCMSGYHLDNGQCVQDIIVAMPATIKVTGVVSTTDETEEETSESDVACLFTTPEIDYCIPGGQCIDNAHVEQNRCQCDDGYEFKDGKCSAVSTTDVETKEASDIEKSYVYVGDKFTSKDDITTKFVECPDSSMDANCICPDDSYYDSVNEECVKITCDLDKQRVTNTYMHNTESYDHTSEAGRSLVEDYYKEQGAYESDCVEEEAVVEEETEEEEALTEEETTEEEEALTEEEAVLTCDELFAILSQAFHDEDWDTYETTMDSLDEDECFGYCESRFYWTIMYISLRDAIAARLYYDDENCTSCIMYNALASYAAKIMSGYDDFIETDAQMLRELLKSSLDYCEAPAGLKEFKNELNFDEDMFFLYNPPEEKPKVSGIFKSFIPTAYAQSTEFSDDVESVIDDVYNETFELPEPEAPPTPECRSLEIIKPDAAVGDQPTILIPLSGYVNEELAIQVDADADAVSLYRYKSLEATITFDNQGHIYDTIKTSVIMNHTDTSKGDIVTVWALDNEGEGIQTCHDSFVVQINTPEPPPVVTAAPVTTTTTTTYVPPTTSATTTAAPVTSEPQVQQVVTAAPVYHAAAAVPTSPENGPGILLYLAGAGIGGVLLKRRKRR